MTVDYFLIDGPHSVPVDFRAWDAAAAGSHERAELDKAGRAAQAVADELESVARAAWGRVNAQARSSP